MQFYDTLNVSAQPWMFSEMGGVRFQKLIQVYVQVFIVEIYIYNINISVAIVSAAIKGKLWKLFKTLKFSDGDADKH